MWNFSLQASSYTKLTTSVCICFHIYVSNLVLSQFSPNIKSKLTLLKWCPSPQHMWKIIVLSSLDVERQHLCTPLLFLSRLNTWLSLNLSLQRKLPVWMFVMLSALQFVCGFHEVLCQNWTQLKHWLEQSKAEGVHDGVTRIQHRQLAPELCFPKEICVYVSS